MDNETIGASNNWDICSDISETDGNENGFINITLANPIPGTPSIIGFTPNASHIISYIHFEITPGASITDGDITYNEYFTSFNQRLRAVVCDDLFTGTITNGPITNTGYATLTVNILPFGNYTFLWKNGRTTQNNTSQCVHWANYVDVTEVNTGCTKRIDFDLLPGSCGFVISGGPRGGGTIIPVIINGDIPINIGGGFTIINPPKLGSFADDEITIQPNPTKGTFAIHFKESDIEEAKVRIYNLAGTLAKEKRIAPNESLALIDASALSNGMYLVKVITNSGEQKFSDKLTIAR